MKTTRQQTTFILALASLFFAGTTILFWSERNTADTRARQINESTSVRVATLTAEKEAVTQTAAQTKAYLDAREKQLATLQAQYTRTHADATKAQTDAAELDKKLTNAQREFETNRTDAERARADAAELDKKLTETRAQVDALNAELAKQRDDTTVKTLQEENKRLRAEIEKHREPVDITKLKIQVLERDATIDNLNGTITSLNEKVTELETENKRLKARLPRLLTRAPTARTNPPMSFAAQLVTLVQILLALGGCLAAARQLTQWQATRAAGGSNTRVTPWQLPVEKFLILLLIAPLCYIVFAIFIQSLKPDWLDQGQFVFPCTLIVQAGTLIILLATARKFSSSFKLPIRAPSQPPPPPQWSIPACFLTMVALITAATYLSESLGKLARLSGLPLDFESRQEAVNLVVRHSDDWAFLAFATVSMVIIAPIAEEIFFRGMIFPFLKGFLKKHLPRNAPALAAALPALLTGALFGLVHGNTTVFLPLAALGTYLCIVYDKTADIRVPIALHALQNLTVLITMLIAPEAS